jgi:hypothetical protein
MTNSYDLLLFGDHCNRAYLAQTSNSWLRTEHEKSLRPEEMLLFRESPRGDSEILAAYKSNLAINRDFFTTIKTRLNSLSRVWDAVMDEKCRNDLGGSPQGNRKFMEALLLAMRIIPERAAIGFLGPFSWESSDGSTPGIANLDVSSSGSSYGSCEPNTPPDLRRPGPAAGNIEEEATSFLNATLGADLFTFQGQENIEQGANNSYPAGSTEAFTFMHPDLEFSFSSVPMPPKMEESPSPTPVPSMLCFPNEDLVKKRKYDEIDKADAHGPQKKKQKKKKGKTVVRFVKDEDRDANAQSTDAVARGYTSSESGNSV